MLKQDHKPYLLTDVLRDLKTLDYKSAEKLSSTIDLLEIEAKYQTLICAQDKELKKHRWVKSQFLEISKIIQDTTAVDTLAQESLILTTPVVEGCCSAFYLLEQWSENEAPFLRQISSYATPEQDTTFGLGEGFVGQCAKDQAALHIKDLPQDYLKLRSGTGEASASSLLLLPIIHENNLKGVFEIASFQGFNEEQIDFLSQTVSALASKINSIEARKTVNNLLLKAHKHNNEIKEHNEKLLAVKKKLEQKNKQAREASLYKSEFLANMSHELRTPLNSLLLLSKKLAQNTHQNLNEQEVEYAEVISNSGQDLLTLINDILDLSKIEAGKMTISETPASVATIQSSMERLFEEVAAKKQLCFETYLAADLPEIIQTDSLRIEQILRNFLTNAFKFTHKGSINFSIEILENTDCLRSTKLRKDKVIAFKVQDTGIGIEKEKLDLVFESFQQADGSTSRQYGGTGLGLSISRELAKLLGGEIHVESTVGEGSIFTLYIPALSIDMTNNMIATRAVVGKPKRPVEFNEVETELQNPICPDDRDKITKETPFILVIEDDPSLAPILVKSIQEKGQLALVTPQAQEGIYLASHYNPSGIILDLNLSHMAGKAAEIKFKGSPTIAKIPMLTLSKPNDSLSILRESLAHTIIAPLGGENLQKALKNFQRLNSAPFTSAQILGKNKKLLKVFEKAKIEGGFIKCIQDMKEKENGFLILDLKSQNIEELLEVNINQPLLLLTDKPLSLDQQNFLNRFMARFLSDIPQGRDLLKEMTFDFIKTLLPQKEDATQKILPPKRTDQKKLHKNVLIVDDDMRNIFALSAVLEDQGLNIIEATNGVEALDILGKDATIDMVLMDIMMPGLDGHAVMESVRNNTKNAYLPVIAMSAKAMKEDRQKALDSGADEFMSKPLNVEELVSVMAFWFKKQQYAS